jgi:hypothetical protein
MDNSQIVVATASGIHVLSLAGALHCRREINIVFALPVD